MMDLSSVIAHFETGTYTVTRTATASYGTDGRSVAGSQSTLQVPATVIPLDGRDLQNLEEGMRTKQLRWVYASGLMYTQDPAHEPDVISIDGDDYQITSVEPWLGLGNYQRYLVMRIGN